MSAYGCGFNRSPNPSTTILNDGLWPQAVV